MMVQAGGVVSPRITQVFLWQCLQAAVGASTKSLDNLIKCSRKANDFLEPLVLDFLFFFVGCIITNPSVAAAVVAVEPTSLNSRF